MFVVKENKQPNICKAYRCKCEKGIKKRFCDKHHARFQKEVNLAGYTYNLLKQNAKRRNKTFGLTLGQFKKFCEATGYLEMKGKKASSASIDCIDPSKGYVEGNIRVLSLSQNSSKGNRFSDESPPF
jgi:hypothetical protein